MGDPRRESLLIEWVEEWLERHGEPPTRQQVQAKAKTFSAPGSNFGASKGWYVRFAQRNPELGLTYTTKKNE